MTTSLKSLALSAIAAAIVVTGVAATPSFAHQSNVPHRHTTLTVGNIGASGQTSAGFATQQGGGSAGPRTGADRIDLSVCDLETFDFDKCLN